MTNLIALPSVTKLSNNIIRILGCNPGLMTLQGTNTYLVGNGRKRILIDSGQRNTASSYIALLQGVLKQENAGIRYILLSHFHGDHVGGVPAIKKMLGVNNLKNAKDPLTILKLPRAPNDNSTIIEEFENIEIVPFHDWEPMNDGQCIEVEGAKLRVKHTPGHATDHACFLLEGENALFSGDCILGKGTSIFEDLQSYLSTLQKILEMKPKIIYPGHGPVINDSIERIQFYIKHRWKREQDIIRVLSGSTRPMSGFEVVEVLYKVLVCDNLSLPFRDESFDAVLSIAVVHHFSTTERRVRALKELARVLRIGGRLIISVWAMEQKHRKFESQDVLIPWPKAYCLDSTSNPIRFSEKYSTSGCPKTHGHPLSSQRRNQQKCRSKSYWIDPIYSPSPSTSSLSSPNETCYSFFRRALQKLAGGRRGSRAWFLENWQNSGKGRRHYDCDDDADTDDIPIELRRLEDLNVVIDNKQSDNLSIKSKSLGDILEIQRLDLVRSRSSIPGLCSTVTSELYLDSQSTTSSSLGSSKPRLVKQKSHLNDDCLDIPQNTAIQRLLSDIPDFQGTSETLSKRSSVHKQSSMNEELMFIERLKEKERVKQNIMKQTSLNEEIMCERTFDKFKDSFYNGNATRRFQLLTSGLTNKIKQSTTSIEKVSGISIRNGFVKIFQSWKSTESQTTPAEPAESQSNSKATPADQSRGSTMPQREVECAERRLSREDGSDSSKDSSLQSDTSVDSEDSFASVIYVPKQQTTQTTTTTTTTAPIIDTIAAYPGYQFLSTASAPPSPRVKYPPEMSSPRMKLITISPLLKQFPATSKSLPPPSPPGLSPRTMNSAPLRPFFNYNNTKEMKDSNERSISNMKDFATRTSDFFSRQKSFSSDTKFVHVSQEASIKPSQTDKIVEKVNEKEIQTSPAANDEVKPTTGKVTWNVESTNEEENRKARLNQIKELLKQKPEFATRTKLSFPLVRRASSAVPGRLETVTKVLPRLLSLELFNPETDDLDSDSSGVSSPESAGSVISVISDERYMSKKENAKKEEIPSEAQDDTKQITDKSEEDSAVKNVEKKLLLSTQPARLAESVTDNVVDVSDNTTNKRKDSEPTKPAKDDLLSLDVPTWSEECRQHLIDFTEKLSENLIHDINQYCQKSQLEYMENFDDKTGTGQENKGTSEFPEVSSLDSTKSCKYSTLVESMPHLKTNTVGKSYGEYDNKPKGNFTSDRRELVHRSTFDDSLNITQDKDIDGITGQRFRGKCGNEDDKQYLRFGNSIESSDIGDSIENTISESSQEESSTNNIARTYNASTASLASSSIDYSSSSSKGSNEKHQRATCTTHVQSTSHLERIPSRITELKNLERSISAGSSGTLSNSSSQESLSSDQEGGGGSITYHQYYHVFREGELDQLINKYVENLHIISSYYDHASWCIVAEKVQVWTI